MKLFLTLLGFLISGLGFAEEQFQIPSGTVTFSHNRPDLKLERLWTQVACFDGVGNWSEDCLDVYVDGVEYDETLIDLPASVDASNRVNIPNLSFHLDSKSGHFFCVGMKVVFEEYPNECDSVLYPPYPDPRSRDRYSLLSFCSVESIPENSSASSRFSNRRKLKWDDFISSLAQPIEMHLTNANPCG